MNQTEVDGQIEHMCKFIEQEALEKANEITDAANEEFNLEKLQLLESEKTSIRKEYQRKESQAEVQKKIAYSKYVNESRLKVLAAREDAIQETIRAAREQLIKVAKGQTYQDLVQQLLIQGLKKLREPSAIVKCREVDKTLVANLIKKVREEYATVYGEGAPEVKLDDKDFLKPPPSPGKDDPAISCCGGVVLTSANGRIVLSNTLDDRLTITFQENLPSILLSEIVSSIPRAVNFDHYLVKGLYQSLTIMSAHSHETDDSYNGHVQARLLGKTPQSTHIDAAVHLCLQCFHEVQQVREILSRVVAAWESGRPSRKTTETARINLYHLLNHPCTREHIELLHLRDFVEKLTQYPNVHVVTMATELLKKPAWNE